MSQSLFFTVTILTKGNIPLLLLTGFIPRYRLGKKNKIKISSFQKIANFYNDKMHGYTI